MITRFLQWFAARPRLTLILAVLAALGPFVTKPFNIDDPMNIWTAQHIQSHPFNFYGYNVNWVGPYGPMSRVATNPPLVCYYLALAAAIVGWSETALHMAFLLPAIAAILGTYRLAHRFCNRPLLAALTTLLTPAFLVCGTTLMSDTLMLAFWIWAVVFWVEGLEEKNSWRLAGSGVLMALAALTKFVGACLIPLLFAYSLIHQRRIGRWAVWFLFPLVALAAYQFATHVLYGNGLLTGAVNWSLSPKTSLGVFTLAASCLTALSFTGGCLAVAVFLAPLVWRTRALIGFALGVALVALVLFREGTLMKGFDFLTPAGRLVLEAQVVFWAIGGITILGLALADAWRAREARSCLLALWVFGTFLFAAFVNWAVNGRSILLMAPAVGILVARRLERVATVQDKCRQKFLRLSLVAGAVLALFVTRADFLFATAVRESAEQTYIRYGRGPRTLWFEGHWGFQYYLEKLGAKAVAAGESDFKQGDLLAVPFNNTNVAPPDEEHTRLLEVLSIRGPGKLATSCGDVGAGFHASVWGPLPFAFGNVPPEKVYIYTIR